MVSERAVTRSARHAHDRAWTAWTTTTKHLLLFYCYPLRRGFDFVSSRWNWKREGSLLGQKWDRRGVSVSHQRGGPCFRHRHGDWWLRVSRNLGRGLAQRSCFLLSFVLVASVCRYDRSTVDYFGSRCRTDGARL